MGAVILVGHRRHPISLILPHWWYCISSASHQKPCLCLGHPAPTKGKSHPGSLQTSPSSHRRVRKPWMATAHTFIISLSRLLSHRLVSETFAAPPHLRQVPTPKGITPHLSDTFSSRVPLTFLVQEHVSYMQWWVVWNADPPSSVSFTSSPTVPSEPLPGVDATALKCSCNTPIRFSSVSTAKTGSNSQRRSVDSKLVNLPAVTF